MSLNRLMYKVMNGCSTFLLFFTAVFSVAVSGSSSKNYVYFISQWCYSGFTKNIPHLSGNNLKNDATYILNSYSTSLPSNCSLRTEEDLIFSIESMGQFSLRLSFRCSF